MLATLQALFNALRTTATAEARSLSRVLFFLIMSAYTMTAIQAVLGNNQQFMLILGIAIIFLNVFQIFRIGRLIRLTAVGEALELARIIPAQAGVISNKLIDIYWRIAVQLTVIISVFCITTPFMPLWRDWWIPVVWPSLFVFAGVASGSVGQKFFRLALTVEILALIFIVSTVMFPQINAQLRIRELSNRFIKTDLADDVNAIERIRKSQRDAEIKRDLSEISEWVQKNPNGKYPDDYFRFLESVRNGEQKTLNEIRYQILHPESVPPPVSKTKQNPPEWELVGNFPLYFGGRIFSDTVGPNGEQAYTGEIYSGCSVDIGYAYKISFSGTYSQFFVHNPWYRDIPWSGWKPQIQFKNEPFKNINYGALVLRIGNIEGLHPLDKKDFIMVTPTEKARIFAELNITREADNYYSSSVGSKLKDSTLSIKIERRPI